MRRASSVFVLGGLVLTACSSAGAAESDSAEMGSPQLSDEAVSVCEDAGLEQIEENSAACLEVFWTQERVQEAIAEADEHRKSEAEISTRQQSSGAQLADPQQAAGLLVAQRPDGTDWYCSASAVESHESAGEAVLATAAHCLHDGDQFYQDAVFIPGYVWGEEFTAYTVINSFVTGDWLEHGGDESRESQAADISFGYVRPNDDDWETTLGQRLEDELYSIEFWDDDRPRVTEVEVLGYPGLNRVPAADRELFSCKGTANSAQTDSDPDSDFWRLGECDLGPGASGGPWLVDLADFGQEGLQLVSVTQGQQVDNSVLQGPRLSEEAAQLFESADISREYNPYL